MREPVLPYLHQLASVSGETASLHIRVGWYGVRIASAPGTAEVTNAPPLGEAHPLGAYFAGRAMLAFLSDAEIARYRAWAVERAVSLREKDGNLHGVKAHGFALGDREFAGARAIAFPLRSATQALAAIAIEGPVFARTDEPPSGLCDWREIIAHIEALARAQPGLFESPFAHLDPDSCVL
jgi:IclR family acetate operon transcriptional repressor